MSLSPCCSARPLLFFISPSHSRAGRRHRVSRFASQEKRPMDETRNPIAPSVAAASWLGLYAALIALAPSPVWQLALALPPVALAVVWWTIQTPSRWLGLFFFSALLLPPVNLPFGNSGPHPAI